MACKLCNERGKTWNGDDPVCAFENGVFSNDNWNCATMNKLRNISEELDKSMRHDMSCGSIGYVPMDNDYTTDDFDTFGGYIVMTWYKERGRTGNAVFMTDSETSPLTIKHAELAITTYEEWSK
jgi:hypothetical protein